MIVCSCRNISDKDYKTLAELEQRLNASDKQCGACVNKLIKGKYIV